MSEAEETRGLAALQALAERRRFGMKPGLETIRALLEALGNPQEGLLPIHIAGTNGKGAVAAMCESVLRAAGYPVGRYTSPHLIRLNERFMVNGAPVSDDCLESVARRVVAAVEAYEAEHGAEVTFFESLTAVAFLLFHEVGTKVVVLETGLGGRLDATNVVTPLLSVITRIGLDHCDWLGDTVEAIAAEKAGIVKPGRPVVCGLMPDAARQVIARAAETAGARLIPAEASVTIASRTGGLEGQTLKVSTQNRSLPPIRFPLAGAFQVENAMTAVAALETAADCGLPIPDEAFVKGLESVCWPGRFQLVCRDPKTLVDGAHNPEGARALAGALKACHVKNPIGLIAGFCGDKDVLGHLRTLQPLVRRAWSVPIPNARSLTPDRTAGLMRMAGIDAVDACGTLGEAWERAAAWARETDGVVVICGSLFLAGDALAFFAERNGDPESRAMFCSGRRDENERLKAESRMDHPVS